MSFETLPFGTVCVILNYLELKIVRGQVLRDHYVIKEKLRNLLELP
jgi:hypothetical protein